jgi:hypothetical protein
MSPSRPLIVLLASAAVLASLSACSLAGGAASGGASNGPSAAPSSGAGASTAGMTAVPTACPDQVEVSSDLGLSVTGGGADASSGCVYESAGHTLPAVSINFALTPGLTPDAAVAKLKSEEPTTSAFGPVSGVGDAAYYDTPPIDSGTSSYLVVLSGPVSFHIVVTSVIPSAKLATLAKHIIAKG